MAGTKVTKSNPKKRGNPKDSHLYTDDNPATTLHGTGFRDRPTAEKTLKLVSRRSLTYQFQTINTMYHRAKGHPKKTAGIEAAMAVFGHWLSTTYPAAKKEIESREGGFKPLLSRDTVGRFLERVKSELVEDEAAFASMYAALPKGKRLANTLLDDKRPGGEDWEGKRLDVLRDLVPRTKTWKDEELWDGGRVGREHLRVIAWGWSPVGEKGLKGRS